MKTAMHVEHAKKERKAMAITALDIYKAFDQIVRPVLYMVLQQAGFPHHVLKAYAGMMEDMHVRNSLAGGVGGLYKRPCAIPQGCPWSMGHLSKLAEGWGKIMEEAGGAPTLLADGLKVRTEAAIGEDVDLCERHHGCVKATLTFFEAMGARIAANTSLSLGTSRALRQRLKRMAWDGRTIPVACDARDLGSHL